MFYARNKVDVRVRNKVFYTNLLLKQDLWFNLLNPQFIENKAYLLRKEILAISNMRYESLIRNRSAYVLSNYDIEYGHHNDVIFDDIAKNIKESCIDKSQNKDLFLFLLFTYKQKDFNFKTIQYKGYNGQFILPDIGEIEQDKLHMNVDGYLLDLEQEFHKRLNEFKCLYSEILTSIGFLQKVLSQEEFKNVLKKVFDEDNALLRKNPNLKDYLANWGIYNFQHIMRLACESEEMNKRMAGLKKYFNIQNKEEKRFSFWQFFKKDNIIIRA